MTNEASTMVVVSRAALEGALRAALPHVARRIPEEAPDNGAGLLRLAVVQDCVMALAAAIDRKRAIATRFSVFDGDNYGDGVTSIPRPRCGRSNLSIFHRRTCFPSTAELTAARCPRGSGHCACRPA